MQRESYYARLQTAEKKLNSALGTPNVNPNKFQSKATNSSKGTPSVDGSNVGVEKGKSDTTTTKHPTGGARWLSSPSTILRGAANSNTDSAALSTNSANLLMNTSQISNATNVAPLTAGPTAGELNNTNNTGSGQYSLSKATQFSHNNSIGLNENIGSSQYTGPSINSNIHPTNKLPDNRISVPVGLQNVNLEPVSYNTASGGLGGLNFRSASRNHLSVPGVAGASRSPDAQPPIVPPIPIHQVQMNNLLSGQMEHFASAGIPLSPRLQQQQQREFENNLQILAESQQKEGRFGSLNGANVSQYAGAMASVQQQQQGGSTGGRPIGSVSSSNYLGGNLGSAAAGGMQNMTNQNPSTTQQLLQDHSAVGSVSNMPTQSFGPPNQIAASPNAQSSNAVRMATTAANVADALQQMQFHSMEKAIERKDKEVETIQREMTKLQFDFRQNAKTLEDRELEVQKYYNNDHFFEAIVNLDHRS